MAIRNPQPRKPEESVVDMAIAALDGSVHPLDLDVRDLDPSPTALGLDGGDEPEACPNPRSGDGVKACIVCGQPPCEHCA